MNGFDSLESEDGGILKQTSTPPSTWISFVDKSTKRVCYYNVTTEQQTWERPANVDEADIEFVEDAHLSSTLTDPEGLDDDFATNGKTFVSPNFNLAIEHRDRLIFRNGKSKVCFSNILVFAEHSEALALYFYFLRSFTITFSIMTLVGLPLILANYNGNGLVNLLQNGNAANSFYAPLSYFSIGNLPLVSSSVDNNNGGVLPKSDAYVNFLGSTMPLHYSAGQGSSGGSIYTFLNAMNYSILIIAWFVIHVFIDIVVNTYISKRTITARNYTVEVKGLPEDTTEDEIIDHMSVYFFSIELLFIKIIINK